MAFVKCSRHGGNGATAVCPHVAQKLRASPPQPGCTEPLFAVYAEYAATTLGPTWLCGMCASSHGVPEQGLRLEGEAGLERYLVEIGFEPVCPKCFANA